MKKLWVSFVAILWITLAGLGQAQTTNASPKFFLFVVNTGKAMGGRDSAAALTVTYIVERAANANMDRGDLFNIWTYGDTVRTTTFQPQVWTPEIRRQVANVAFYHLIKQKWTGKSDTSKAMQLIKAEIATRQNLFIYLISTGADLIIGTPFDIEINDACRQNAQTWRDLNAVSVIALVAEKGQIVDWAVGMSLPPDYVKPIARKPLPPPPVLAKTNAPPKQVTLPKPKIVPQPFIMRPVPEPEKPVDKPAAPVAPKPVPTPSKTVPENQPAPKPLPLVKADQPMVVPPPSPVAIVAKPKDEAKPLVAAPPQPLVAAPLKVAVPPTVTPPALPPALLKSDNIPTITPPPEPTTVAAIVPAPEKTSTPMADKKLESATKPMAPTPVVQAKPDVVAKSPIQPSIYTNTPSKPIALADTNMPLVAHASPVENLSAFVKLTTAVILIALALIIAMLWRRTHQPAQQSIISQSLDKKPEHPVRKK